MESRSSSSMSEAQAPLNRRLGVPEDKRFEISDCCRKTLLAVGIVAGMILGLAAIPGTLGIIGFTTGGAPFFMLGIANTLTFPGVIAMTALGAGSAFLAIGALIGFAIAQCRNSNKDQEDVQITIQGGGSGIRQRDTLIQDFESSEALDQYIALLKTECTLGNGYEDKVYIRLAQVHHSDEDKGWYAILHYPKMLGGTNEQHATQVIPDLQSDRQGYATKDKAEEAFDTFMKNKTFEYEIAPDLALPEQTG